MFKNKNKKATKFINYILDKKIVILGFIFGLVIGLAIMSTQIPVQIAKLSDGSESIAVFDNGSLSSDELFERLKELTNISAVLDVIDSKLLESSYPYKEYYESALTQAEENLAYAKENDVTEADFLSYYGFVDYVSFVEYLTLEGQRYAYYQDYLKTQISEKDMKSYYKNEAFGDINTQYIAVTSVEDSATDETLAKEILAKVKNGASYAEIVKEYSSNSSVTYADLSYISFDGDTDKDYVNALLKMKDNTSATNYVLTDAYGYTIIFREDQKDKEDYADIDTVIQGVLMTELDASDENLYINTFINMRKKAGLEFTDTNFKKQYQEYVKSYK